MSVTRTQALANTREMMDGVGSSRWSDTWIKTVLGLVFLREWEQILGANPYYRFAQRSVTTDSAGQFAYTALNSGSADSAQTLNKILSISDGQTIYEQTEFRDAPVATTSASGLSARRWYDAGANVQILPATANLVLTVSVNYTPPRVDDLAADGSAIDFPAGSEAILYLEAAAMLLSKGGMENDAAQTMRAMADQERQSMFARITRRSVKPLSLGYPDSAADWGG